MILKINLPIPLDVLIFKSELKFKTSEGLTKNMYFWIFCLIISFKNPYFKLKRRNWQKAKFNELVNNLEIVIESEVNKDKMYISSKYKLNGIERVIVTEIRRTVAHAYYFHFHRLMGIFAVDRLRMTK